MTQAMLASLGANLRAQGFCPQGKDPVFEPLTGGVASDIWLVKSDGGDFVVKRALSKLRVAADWQVPLSRNACEVAWFKWVGQIAPDTVPKILAHDEALGFFVMEFLPPQEYPVWKKELQPGRADPRFSAEVGASLGTIHAATAGHEARAQDFNNNTVFHAIRLEPYLEATARHHPRLAPALHGLVKQTLLNRKALVHGDVSPKNILVGPKGPVFLDAECAWYGDPAFDLAFCLNHLLLKSLWQPPYASLFVQCFKSLLKAYLERVTWEPVAELERRAAQLLPALMLARIDGKSPVEYITAEADKAALRRFAIEWIETPVATLAQIAATWSQEFDRSQQGKS